MFLQKTLSNIQDDQVINAVVCFLSFFLFFFLFFLVGILCEFFRVEKLFLELSLSIYS